MFLETGENSNKLDKFLSTILGKNIPYVSLGLINSNKVLCAFSHKEWQEKYLNLALHLHDPSFQAAIKVPNLPFLWSSIPKNTKKAAQVMNLRCEMVGAISGITIRFSGKNHRDLLLTLGARLDNKEILQKFEQLIPATYEFIKDI